MSFLCFLSVSPGPWLSITSTTLLYQPKLFLSVSVSPIHVKCKTGTGVQGMILCWLCEFGACFCSCAQSGNGRHTSHQRKINQQEESCQNLTDFTPARVPSKVDIFTAYNDSLQCSHECVRTAVPVYTDEMIQHTPIYKTTYNGSRWEMHPVQGA